MPSERDLHQLNNLLYSKNFDADVFEMEPMFKHTSYKIGGPASLFVSVNTLDALKELLSFSHFLNWTVIGNGTNLLVSDNGYQGLVIKLGREFKKFQYEDGYYNAGAGVVLARLVNDAFRNAYSGFEFAVGTPGTLGGALFMNAGTKTDWIGSRVETITILDSKGNISELDANEIDWQYRHTNISGIILFAKLKVSQLQSDKEIYELKARMEGILDKRRNNQPLNKPSCGSMFKNPKDMSAGKMIENAGLKGYRCGGAEVSRKHANFIINRGRATALDVVTLMRHIQQEIFDVYGVKLHPEVRFLGFREECSLWQ